MRDKMTEYLLKHSKNKDQELKYDFMPSMLEIIEKPANRGGTVIITAIFVLLLGAIVWSCFSKVDVVVTASGTVKPVGDLNIVKSFTAGTIDEILISEGDYVEAGQLLIKLDTDSVAIDEAAVTLQLETVTTQIELYNKILSGEQVTNIQTTAYSETLQPVIRSIVENEKSYRHTLESLELDKTTAKLSKEIAELNLEEYRKAEDAAKIQTQEISVKQHEINYQKAVVNLENTKTQHTQEINESLSALRKQENELKSSLEKAQLNQEYQNIVAPISGYVNTIGVNTVGGVVTAAQDLVSIVPENADLEMVCYIKNMDIADIKVGDDTVIKLEAYPYSRYGTLSGRITYISPSAFSDEKLGSVYLVRIVPDSVSDSMQLISGMSGIAEIKTGNRSIMDYFLDPILNGMDESLREK